MTRVFFVYIDWTLEFIARPFYGHDNYLRGANRTLGGDGVAGVKHTEEWLDLYARGVNNKNFGKTGENWWLHGKPNPMLDRSHSDKANEKNRQTHLGKRHTSTSIAK